MEKQYQITLNEDQLNLISRSLDILARIKSGQLDIGLEDILNEALLKQKYKGKMTDDFWDERDEITEMLKALKLKVWNQHYNASHGVNYSEETDTMRDMHEVMRHVRWLETSPLQSYTVDASPPYHWNKLVPLIKVKKI